MFFLSDFCQCCVSVSCNGTNVLSDLALNSHPISIFNSHGCLHSPVHFKKLLCAMLRIACTYVYKHKYWEDNLVPFQIIKSKIASCPLEKQILVSMTTIKPLFVSKALRVSLPSEIQAAAIPKELTARIH